MDNNNKNTGFTLHKEEPGLSDILEQLKLNVLSNINCHNVGRIIEFDKNTQTCTVELMQIKKFNDRLYTPAPITQVPLIIYGAQNGHITLPNPVGTIALLFFNDRNMDNFMLTGEQYVPDTTRMHDFTDCVAITTFKTLANPLADYDERAVSIFNEEVINETKNNSDIKVYGNSIELDSADAEENSSHISITPVSIAVNTTDKTETAENITVNASDVISVNSSDYENTAQNIKLNSDDYENASTLGGKITVNSRIGISNSAQNLALLIQSFITACENIAVKTDTGLLTDASKAQFTNLKAQFSALLE